MPTLEEIFKALHDQVQSGTGRRGKNGVVYADRIVKLPGLQRFTLKINAASDGHYSLIVYRGNNIKRQFALFPEDADELLAIANFLKKYQSTLSKYIKYGRNGRSTAEVVEVDLGESEESGESNNKQSSQKKSQKKSQKEPESIEEEFETE